MKNLFKKLLVLCAIIATTSVTFNFAAPQPASAADDTKDCRYFLGMVSWDCNTGFVAQDSGKMEKLSETKIKSGIWIAVANVITDITVIATYLVIGYVIYGGYRYIFSGGDPGKVAAGKKTLAQAFIGLAIVMSATIIMNTIRIALGTNFSDDCATTKTCINTVSPGKMVTNTIHWVTAVAGIVSAIFVVYGGVMYMTSSGEPSKIQQAKKMILYALIGLAIVGLTEVITAFVSNTIREADENAFINETIISKEIQPHEQIN